jgi:putative phosphoesterase
VISDVHCNVAAFEHAIDDLRPRVDEIWLAGDAIYEYRFSNTIIRAVRDLGIRSILGNHELMFLSQLGDRARAATDVDQEALAWLAQVPLELDVTVDDTRVLMVHATPWPPHSEYMHGRSASLARCADVDADILIYGHTHIPLVRQVGSTLVVNPGSLGESREAGARQVSTYAIVDTDTRTAEIVRFPNPAFASG